MMEFIVTDLAKIHLNKYIFKCLLLYFVIWNIVWFKNLKVSLDKIVDIVLSRRCNSNKSKCYILPGSFNTCKNTQKIWKLKAQGSE